MGALGPSCLLCVPKPVLFSYYLHLMYDGRAFGDLSRAYVKLETAVATFFSFMTLARDGVPYSMGWAFCTDGDDWYVRAESGDMLVVIRVAVR